MKNRPIIFTAESVRAILAGTKTQTRRIIKTRHPVNFIGSAGDEAHASDWGYFFDGPDHNGYMVLGQGHDERQNHGRISIHCPYGEVGERLWVKEVWQAWHRCSVEHDEWEPITAESRHGVSWSEFVEQNGKPDGIEYKADGKSMGTWTSPMFMPRFASRLTLEVSEVRVQRLQDISEDDARAEGVEPLVTLHKVYPSKHAADIEHRSFREGYAKVWDQINGKRRRREFLTLGDPGYMLGGRHWRTVVDESASWASNPWVWTITFSRVP